MKKFKLDIKPEPTEVTKHVIVNNELTEVFAVFDTLEEAQHSFVNRLNKSENYRIITLKLLLISYQETLPEKPMTITFHSIPVNVTKCYYFLHNLIVYEVDFLAPFAYMYSVPTKEKCIHNMPIQTFQSEYAFFICLELAKLKMKEVTKKLLNT